MPPKKADLLKQLEDNDASLTVCDLSFLGGGFGSGLTPENYKTIADALKKNTNCRELRMDGIKTHSNQTLAAIFEALKENKSLKVLSIVDAKIDDTAFKVMADMLTVNECLEEISIGTAKSPGDPALVEIIKAFTKNITMQRINWRLKSRLSFKMTSVLVRNVEIKKRKESGTDWSAMDPRSKTDEDEVDENDEGAARIFFRKYDTDGNKTLDKEEFLAMMKDMYKSRDPDAYPKIQKDMPKISEDAFKKGDKDNSGAIDEKEFIEVFRELVKTQKTFGRKASGFFSVKK